MKQPFFIAGVLSLFVPCLVHGGRLDVVQAENEVTARLDGRTLWTFRHDPAEGKPYFHPLTSVDGVVFTDLRPEDHPWHRGAWFSWKFINGVNYWEEDRQTGESAGRTILHSVERTVEEGRPVRLTLGLAYAPAGTDEPVMREAREVVISTPGTKGAYTVDWSSEFRALEEDVVLDRTPLPGEPGGKDYGGYAGWSVRMGPGVKEGTFVNSRGRTGPATHRQRAEWMLYTAPQGSGILFLDHPENPGFPSKWFVAPGMPYFSPALIHDAPRTIRAGDTLRLRYRLVVAAKGVVTPETAAARAWGIRGE